MPATDFHEYAQSIATLLGTLATAGRITRVSLETDPRSTRRGLIVGALLFEDGSELHFREFVDLTLSEPRMMYAYHYQDASKALILRYDNAAHRPPLSQLSHKHTSAGAVVASAPTLAEVLDEILPSR